MATQQIEAPDVHKHVNVELDPQVKIYLASSWRNNAHDGILMILRAAGLHVFNYRETNASFQWKELDENWRMWTTEQYLQALETEKAKRAFANDMGGLEDCTHLVMIEPSGNSAHAELGWAVGRGLKTAIFHSHRPNPELMSKMSDLQTDSMIDLLLWLGITD